MSLATPVPSPPSPDVRYATEPVLRSTHRWLVGLVVVGGVLRLWDLGGSRLGFDEAFTGMAGRMPVGGLFGYLRVRDSHPPLDYLLHLPLARLGVSELWFRMPSVLCSIAALALFAWWMRSRGLAGIVATGLLAVSAFQLVHGRQARMYADLELIGVAVAVVADGWLRRPRRWHAWAIFGLVFAGLLTHVSMFLLGAGLLALAGRRMDREAWRWRGALAAGLLGWAALWGPSFLAQTRGGNSDWIPPTTLSRLIDTIGRLVTYEPGLALLAVLAVGAGAFAIARVDRPLLKVWLCCFAIPAGLAAVTGIVAPVLLDRTLTAVSWAPLLAIGFLVAAFAQRSRVAAGVAIAALVVLMVPTAIGTVTTRSNPDRVLRHIEAIARPGDVLEIHPGGRLHELEWSLGVRTGEPFRVVDVSTFPKTLGIVRGNAPLSGRVVLLDWTKRPLPVPTASRCAPDWNRGGARVYCLDLPAIRFRTASAGTARRPVAVLAPSH